MFKRENQYDAETYEITVPLDPSQPDGKSVKIGVFDKVMVEISVEKVNRFCSFVSSVTDCLSISSGQKHTERPSEDVVVRTCRFSRTVEAIERQLFLHPR